MWVPDAGWLLSLQSQDREGDVILLFLERLQGATCRWLGSQKSIIGPFYHWETGLRVQYWGRRSSLGSSCQSTGQALGLPVLYAAI